ncbi:MAG: SpaA isopeptide-forming pilin-related protein [Coprobacillus sp.]
MAKKKFMIVFLSLVLIMGMKVIPSYAIDSVDGTSLVKNVQLTKKGGTEFSSKEELGFGDTFKVKLSLNDITGHSELSGQLVEVGKSYILITLPKELAAEANEDDKDIEWQVNINDGKALGKAKYSKRTREISFIFHEDIKDEDTITNAYIEMEVQLDKAGCGDKQVVDISMNGETPKYSITITENKPKPPVVKKEVLYNTTDKTFDWTVSIISGSIVYDEGLSFVDTFSNNQEYVANSFTVNKNPINDLLLDIQGQTLSYLTPLDGDKDYNITYKTKLNNSALITNGKVENDKTVIVSNKAQLNDKKNNVLVSSDIKELKQKTGINWIEKNVVDETVKDNTVYVPWSIAVDTNGFAFKNLVVKDVFKKGKPVNDSSELSIVKESIEVNGISVPWEKITTLNNSSIVDKNDYTWTVNLNDVLKSETLNGKYTITYETKITNYSEYLKYNQDPISNDVSISFECPEFGGPGEGAKIYGTPVVSKEAIVNAGTIKKDFVSYSKSNHQMTWKVTFNENKNTISEKVTIKDTISLDDEHKLIEIKNLMIDGKVASSQVYEIDKTDKEYTVVFKDSSQISGQTVTFEIVSELTNPDFYESNNQQTKEFVNYATVYLGNTKYSTVNAKYKPEIKVLSKEAKGYDFKQHLINWEIKVNHDGMRLKNAIIEDKLISGLSLVEDSLVLKDNNGTISLSKDSVNPHYTYLDNYLKVYLGDITETYTLSFQTKVDTVNGKFLDKDFKTYNGKISIINNVSLNKDTSQSTVVKAQQDILNKVLEKNGTVKSDEQKINYQVVVNQAMTPMVDTQLNDILSPGLTLSLPTIHLFEATIDSKGQFVKQREVVDVKYGTKVLDKVNDYGKPQGSTLLTLTIPKNEGRAYILEYSAYVKDFDLSKYSNDIQGEGIIPGETKTSVVMSSDEVGVGGGAQVSKSSMVVYTLVDEKDKNKVIPDAEFTLYYKGKVVGVAVTDEKGKVIFNGLEEGLEYELVQTKTTDGYLPEKAVHTHFVAPKKGYANRKEITVENVKRPFNVSNVDDKGNGIEGSEFELYKVTDDVNEVLDKDKLENMITDANLVEKQLTDKDGTILFNEDMRDGLYIVRQASVPSDYILSNDDLVVKIVNGLVFNIYQLSDIDKVFDNVVVNRRKVLIPEPDTSIPDPIIPNPTPNPIIPNPTPNTPIVKPETPNNIIKPTKTGDVLPMDIVVMFISSLSLLLGFRRKLKK